MAETFTHDVEGVGELRFAHLTLLDVFGDPDKTELNGFVPIHRKRKKRAMLENLRELGYERDEQLSYLDGFDRNAPSIDDFVEYIGTPTSAAVVVAFAWRGANGDKPVPTLPPADETEVVWKLLAPLGIVRRAQPDDAPTPGYGEEGGAVAEPGNPPMPPTYSTPAAAGNPTTTTNP